MKPNLPTVTLVCIDTTDKVHLAERAIAKSLEQCNFGAVKLLTNDTNRKHAVHINRLNGIEAYSEFCVRHLHNYIQTKHCLIVQHDGYVLDGSKWTNEFLHFDYIGAPWNQWRIVGNGGFSLRSHRLLKFLSTLAPGEIGHPEDSWICHRHRAVIEQAGFRFATLPLAQLFAFEGREFNGHTWQGAKFQYNETFGFHSWLSPLADSVDKPLIFHHSGDMGDVIYSLATIKALGGGVLFVSPENRHPWPRPTRVQPSVEWAENFLPLVRHQDYIWFASYTGDLPSSVDVDLNRHRELYRTNGAEKWDTLFRLHLKAFGVDYPENRPWLTVRNPCHDSARPIVVNRTPRYRNENFPWGDLLRQYSKQMVFIGTDDEYLNFLGLGAPDYIVPHIRTRNMMDAARVIAGCKLFIGNQSACMAVALGLMKPAVMEVWQGNPNCIFKRENLYWEYSEINKATIDYLLTL